MLNQLIKIPLYDSTSENLDSPIYSWTRCTQYAPVDSSAIGPDAFRPTGNATAT